MREQIESIVGYGEEGAGEQAPFSSRSKKVLEFALREALQLGHNYVGTEHILLGLTDETEGVAARVLSNLDVDPDKVRREVVRMLGGGRSGRSQSSVLERRARIRSSLELKPEQIPQGFELNQSIQDNSPVSIGPIAWSPDGQLLAASSGIGRIRLWDVDTEERRTISQHVGRANVRWSPDGSMFAAGASDGTVRILYAGTYQDVMHIPGNGYAASDLAWSAHGSTLAVSTKDGAIKLFDKATEQVSELREHPSGVNTVAWSPTESTLLASGADDSTIQLWSFELSLKDYTVRPLRGHTDSVRALTWSPNGQILASAGGEADPTIRIWDSRSWHQTNILSVHTTSVESISFSADGSLLASRSSDGVTILWRTDTWAEIAELTESTDEVSESGLAFHPRISDTLATPGAYDTAIRIWKLNLTQLHDNTASQTERSKSAKVVLVGESNIGKSCMAMRLAEDRYPDDSELGTTHGMQFWRIQPGRLAHFAPPSEHEHREVVLWDMGGQDEYRLIHQLFFRDTALALIFLDPTRGRAAFEEVEVWNKQLERHLSNTAAIKLLVGSKLDEPSSTIDHAGLEQLMEKCGFAGYYETSALTRRGVSELEAAIAEHIDWDALTIASQTTLFRQVQDEVDRERDNGEVVLPLDKLQEIIEDVRQDEHDTTSVDTVAKQLAAQGSITDTRLVSGERMLVLRIEEVERYAGALILAARNSPRGIPALEERTLALPAPPLHGIKQRLPRPQELVVLECVTELLIKHGICFRHEKLLVFPSLFTEVEDERTDLAHSVSLYYDLTGAIDNIYASLVAQLAISGDFGQHRLWGNRVEFEKLGHGVCGIRRLNRAGGLAHLDLYFAEDTAIETRDLFVDFVESHLRYHGVEVIEHLRVECETCHTEIPEEIVQQNITRGQKDVICPVCRPPISIAIGEGVATIRQRAENSDFNIVALRKELVRDKIKGKTAKDAQAVKEAVTSGGINPQDTKNPIRILHLSDLHFTGDTSPITKLQWLINDLRGGLRLEVDSIEYLVISGDVTDKGNEDGFQKAQEFVSLLNKEIGVSGHRCIFVPGNHDLRDQTNSYKMEFPENVQNVDPERCVRQGDIYLVRDDQMYPDRFASFSKSFYHNILMEPYPLELNKQGLAYTFPDTRIQLDFSHSRRVANRVG